MRDHKSISLESHLAHLPLFAGMSASDIEHIASCSKLIHAKKGDVLRAGPGNSDSRISDSLAQSTAA